MYRSIILALAGVLSLASLSQATFVITGQPSAQPAPAGRIALDLFAQNDAGGADGSNLQAAKITFTGQNGTKAFFATFDPGDGTIGVDQWNFGAAAQSNTILDLGGSNLRLGTKALNTHTFTNFPGDVDSPITADQAANGLSSFGADYALLSAAQSVPSTTAPGTRFARLVVNDIPSLSFMVVANLAGETGAGVDYTFSIHIDPPPGPTILPVAPTPVVFGSTVSNGQPFSVTIQATDPNQGSNLSLALGTLPAGITGTAVSGGGASPATFTVTGNVAYSLNMTTVTIPITVANGLGSTTNGSFALVVTPEPASLAALASVAALGATRRRR
jgi:hypothetical protein